jgi:uncharacterized RDD family membrane protein YckC
MEKITVQTSLNIELEFESAPFHKRFFALIIDAIILYAYTYITSRIIDSFNANSTSDNLPLLYNLSGLQMIFYVPVLMYHLVCESLMNGQSIGKKICQVRVISDNGGRAAFHQLVLRWLLRPVDITMVLPGLISYMSTKKNQRLGDLAAGTMVIDTQLSSDLNETVFFELENDYKPKYTNVLRLSDRDMNLVKGVLDAAVKQNNTALLYRTTAKIREVLNITEYEEDVTFLETILKDYNYLSNQN